jgi:class 3 adenylate cyclase
VHARLLRQAEELVLVHESRTNGTFVNGVNVTGRQALFDGDEIRLADRIVLRVDAPWLRAGAAAPAGSLRGAMEARVRLEERIEQEFVRRGSFLDVDVVDSYGMKAAEERVERVVVSFERFRAFLARAVEAHRGRILNCNGDEVAAFFETAEDGFAAARTLLEGLEAFNAVENLLGVPFRVRCGIHSGRSAVDLRHGIAYSAILDAAGHLQKTSPVNGVLLSAATVEQLRDRSGLSEAEGRTRDGLTAWLWRLREPRA